MMMKLNDYLEYIDDSWNYALVPSMLEGPELSKANIKRIGDFYLFAYSEVPVLLRIIYELLDNKDRDNAMIWINQMINEN